MPFRAITATITGTQPERLLASRGQRPSSQARSDGRLRQAGAGDGSPGNGHDILPTGQHRNDGYPADPGYGLQKSPQQQGHGLEPWSPDRSQGPGAYPVSGRRGRHEAGWSGDSGQRRTGPSTRAADGRESGPEPIRAPAEPAVPDRGSYFDVFLPLPKGVDTQ